MEDDKKIKPKAKGKVKDEKQFVKNTIEINPTIEEAAEKTVVLGWGRMNPITSGHEILANKIKEIARRNRATPVIYLTHSQDPKKNPLSYNDKVRLAQKAFGPMIKKSNAKTIIQAMQELEKSFDNVVLVVGADRINEFTSLLNKYNGKDFTFKDIKVISAGERADPDSDAAKDLSAKNMSASVMRKLAAQGNKEDFVKGLPKKLQRDADAVFDMVRAGMKLAEELEAEGLLDEAVLSFAQRRQRANTMRRFKGKIAAARKRMAKRRATPEKLKIRARKKAIEVLRGKIAGEKGKSYSTLTTGEKIVIDKKVEKRKAAIEKIAKKLLPKVRKAETEKFSKRHTVNEEFEALFEGVAQDKDIKDRKGTQPAKYHSGLSKSTKAKRDAHFKKGAKMDDNNPDAYKPAPGDADAKTKESKHTKKYRELFGEASERDTQPRKRYHNLLNKEGTVKHDKRFKRNRKIAEATELQRLQKTHNTEKEAMKKQHDLEVRRVKIRNLRRGNTQEEFVNIEDDKDLLEWIELISQDVLKGIEIEEAKAMEGLKKKAEKSGIPYGTLKKVYDRGVAAWRTGHRPGTTPQQWGYARVNSFITGGKTRTTADADLARGLRKEDVDLDDLFELQMLDEAVALDRALQAIHKHVNAGKELGDIAFQVSRAAGVEFSSQELRKKYVEKFGDPKRKVKVNPEIRAKFKRKFGFKEESGAGEWGTKKLAKKYKTDTPGQDINEEFENLVEEVTQKQIKDLEAFADRLLDKFGVDVEFTRHFADRMNDTRNSPPISVAELQRFFKKVAKNKAKDIKQNANSEAVLKDIQADLNLPVVIKFNRDKEEFEVVNKTIMRKKNFSTSNKVIKY